MLWRQSSASSVIALIHIGQLWVTEQDWANAACPRDYNKELKKDAGAEAISGLQDCSRRVLKEPDVHALIAHSPK